jgi:hypothetical protein
MAKAHDIVRGVQQPKGGDPVSHCFMTGFEMLVVADGIATI